MIIINGGTSLSFLFLAAPFVSTPLPSALPDGLHRGVAHARIAHCPHLRQLDVPPVIHPSVLHPPDHVPALVHRWVVAASLVGGLIGRMLFAEVLIRGDIGAFVADVLVVLVLLLLP